MYQQIKTTLHLELDLTENKNVQTRKPHTSFSKGLLRLMHASSMVNEPRIVALELAQFHINVLFDICIKA